MFIQCKHISMICFLLSQGYGIVLVYTNEAGPILVTNFLLLFLASYLSSIQSYYLGISSV